MPATRTALLVAGLLISGCQGPTDTSDIALLGSANPANSDYKTARYAKAVEGLHFEGDRIEVDAFGRTDLRRAAEAEAEAARLAATGYRIEAIKAYADAIRWAPRETSAYVGLGEILRLKGKVDEALAAWRTALAIDPDLAEAQFQVALTLWQRGHREEAAAEMRRTLQLDPQHAQAHGQLAVWSFYAGDDDAAWQHATAAQTLGHQMPPQLMQRLEARTPNPDQPH